jgi:hypothetical protein
VRRKTQQFLQTQSRYFMDKGYSFFMPLVREKCCCKAIYFEPVYPVVRLCGLVVRVLGFDSRHYQKKVVGLERGPLSLVSTN